GVLRVLAHRELLLDARGLAGPVAQVVELGAAHVATSLDDDRGDQGRIQLERTLHAFARGDLAHGERGVQPAVASRDDDALVGLDALAGALDDVDVDDDRVARPEVRDVLAQPGDFLLFEQLDDVHFSSWDHRSAALGMCRDCPPRGWRTGDYSGFSSPLPTGPGSGRPSTSPGTPPCPAGRA